MAAQELRSYLLKLDTHERLEAIQVLLKAVSAHTRGISKKPNVMGGEACITGTRIPVWLLVSYRQTGMSDSKILEGYPDISAAELVEVWAYAEAHISEVEAAIQAQDEADAGLAEAV